VRVGIDDSTFVPLIPKVDNFLARFKMPGAADRSEESIVPVAPAPAEVLETHEEALDDSSTRSLLLSRLASPAVCQHPNCWHPRSDPRPIVPSIWTLAH
jgi:hypothetical protein